MVAITVILAAVIAAFVFGIGGQQSAAPTASIVAANNPDTTTIDLKIQHKGGDTLKGGDWKLSVVKVGDAPSFNNSAAGSNLAVGNQISVNTTTDSNSIITNQTVTPITVALVSGQKYDVKLVHVPSNAMLLDTVVEVR
jgi:archaeal type IV pilus assembly protein PilA